MLRPEQERVLLDATALGLDDDLRAAYRRLLDLIRAGTPPRDAVAEVVKTFQGEYAKLLADGFGAILDRSIGAPSVLTMQVSGVSLSARLYAESYATSGIVAGIVERHAKGWHEARKLTLDLYEGYGFRESEALNLSPRNPKLPKYLCSELLTDPGLAGELRRHFTRVHVAGLKTPHLKAAYLEALDAMEQGKGQEVLERKLRVAFHERMRYFANRIAQTELHRAYADRQAVEIMDDAGVGFVKWHMSGTHPKLDICDYFAKVDKYGLGPGVYPKALAPKAPAHPHCRCILQPLTGMPPDTRWRERPDAARAWIKAQGINNGAAIMGSRERLGQVLNGADPVAVHNSRTDPLYRVRQVGGGEVTPLVADRMPNMKPHPDALPNATQAEIPLEKLERYALNLEHPTGANKARRIKAALGFSASDSEKVAALVRDALPAHPAKAVESNAWVVTFYVDLPLTGPAGMAIVRTAWILETGQNTPSMTSFYVKES